MNFGWLVYINIKSKLVLSFFKPFLESLPKDLELVGAIFLLMGTLTQIVLNTTDNISSLFIEKSKKISSKFSFGVS